MNQDLKQFDWNQAIADGTNVEFEDSWYGDLVDLPPVVSAKIGSRRIKTLSLIHI